MPPAGSGSRSKFHVGMRAMYHNRYFDLRWGFGCHASPMEHGGNLVIDQLLVLHRLVFDILSFSSSFDILSSSSFDILSFSSSISCPFLLLLFIIFPL